ncbi:MAG: hypothetical protein ACFFBZ_14435 [Promethearchaeota archaeon]
MGETVRFVKEQYNRQSTISLHSHLVSVKLIGDNLYNHVSLQQKGT